MYPQIIHNFIHRYMKHHGCHKNIFSPFHFFRLGIKILGDSRTYSKLQSCFKSQVNNTAVWNYYASLPWLKKIWIFVISIRNIEKHWFEEHLSYNESYLFVKYKTLWPPSLKRISKRDQNCYLYGHLGRINKEHIAENNDNTITN